MVSKNNAIQTNTKCICGNGDTVNAIKAYFKNECPNCGKEGTLQAETTSNIEVDDTVTLPTTPSDNTTDDTNDNTNLSSSIKVVCKYCGSEFCGQDGYDLMGGTRASLTSVNPNEITEEDEETSTTDDENETTYMSGWEGLCDLLKPLDGEAMIVQRGDYVLIKKIEMPQTARLWAYEGINVVDDSVTITDYTPEIYNTFIIKWGESYENELEFVFNKHKQLFGERKIVMEANKISVVNNDNGEDSEENENDDKKNSNSVTDDIFNSNTSPEDVENTDLSNLQGDSEDNENTNTEEIPITSKEEAIQFGLTQVGKAKREDGHTIELKVIGNHKWQMGEWCHVKLPSFNEDSYMFISKCSFESSPDSEFINSLTLVDYPPSLGKPSKKNQEEENTDDADEDSDSSNSDTNSDSNSDETNTDTDNTDNQDTN